MRESDVIELGDERFMVMQHITEEEAHEKDAKPCYLSALIYTYARRKMTAIYQYGFD